MGECAGGWLGGWLDGGAEARAEGRTDGWMGNERGTDGWGTKGERMDGWIDESIYIDIRIYRCMEGRGERGGEKGANAAPSPLALRKLR